MGFWRGINRSWDSIYNSGVIRGQCRIDIGRVEVSQ